ncbi:MAG: ATP-binding protein, partial [Planctomycetota bacterium]
LVEANPDSLAIDFLIKREAGFPDKVQIDRERIGQVVWNLLENSRVACDKYNGKITACIASIGDSDSFSVSILDNGSGISPENFNTIFQPFFTTKTKGTGLGLAICQRIIQAHHGSLVAENHANNGAKFTFSLPK